MSSSFSPSWHCPKLTRTVGEVCRFEFFGSVGVGVVGTLHFVQVPHRSVVIHIASTKRRRVVVC